MITVVSVTVKYHSYLEKKSNLDEFSHKSPLLYSYYEGT